MNRDYDFYDHIIKQEHPNDLNTIVNKYYQVDENYAPDDLVEINNKSLKSMVFSMVNIRLEKVYMMILLLYKRLVIKRALSYT